MSLERELTEIVTFRKKEAESSTGESRNVTGKDKYLELLKVESVQDLSF